MKSRYVGGEYMHFMTANILYVPSWHGSQRRASFISTAASIAYCPIGGATVITIIWHPLGSVIGVGSGGGWGPGTSHQKAA
jgi:hypothetical protein